MKTKSVFAGSGRIRDRINIRVAGVTLVEVMIAMGIFMMLSSAIATTLIQLRRQGENSVSLALADATAEGLLEQVRRTNYGALSDLSGTSNTSVDLLFIDVNASNRATVQPYPFTWSPDDTTFHAIGAMVDPTVTPDSAIQFRGVLLDVDYKDTLGNTIRPRRYMPMKINLTRTVNANLDAVQVCLRYQWAVPDRVSATGGIVYYPPREIRTIISKMPTY